MTENEPAAMPAHDTHLARALQADAAPLLLRWVYGASGDRRQVLDLLALRMLTVAHQRRWRIKPDAIAAACVDIASRVDEVFEVPDTQARAKEVRLRKSTYLNLLEATAGELGSMIDEAALRFVEALGGDRELARDFIRHSVRMVSETANEESIDARRPSITLLPKSTVLLASIRERVRESFNADLMAKHGHAPKWLPEIDPEKSYPEFSFAEVKGGLAVSLRKTDPLHGKPRDCGWSFIALDLRCELGDYDDLGNVTFDFTLSDGTVLASIPIPYHLLAVEDLEAQLGRPMSDGEYDEVYAAWWAALREMFAKLDDKIYEKVPAIAQAAAGAWAAIGVRETRSAA
jgi:hypothetical protein